MSSNTDFDLQASLRSTAAVMESRPLPGEVSGSFERFVLDHGTPYESQPLTRAEKQVVDAAINEYRVTHGNFEWRLCFTNSQELLENAEAKKLVYVEGFAWTHALRPVLHGWLTINGKVIDVTLPPTNRREAKLAEPLQVLGEFSSRSYFGVPFLRSYIARRFNVTGDHGSLFDDHEHAYPLLRSGPAGAVRRHRR